MNVIGNTNTQIINLLVNHGIPAQLIEGKVWSEINPEVYIDSQIHSLAHEKGFTTQLNIKVETPSGHIYECFADVNEAEEEAVKNNLENFCRNSFHPIISCLYGYTTNDISIEEWKVNDKQWKVYMGNYGVKVSQGTQVAIPQDLFPAIEKFIHCLPLKEALHWLRFYICFTDGELVSSECLVDNELNERGQQAIESASWNTIEGFYSLRLFVIFEQIKTPTTVYLSDEKVISSGNRNILKTLWSKLTAK
jgi:hypothetical protein